MKGPMADVFLAAITASEVAGKLIKPGNSNSSVTAAVAKVAEAFGVNAVQGTLMHQMKRCVSSSLSAFVSWLNGWMDQRMVVVCTCLNASCVWSSFPSPLGGQHHGDRDGWLLKAIARPLFLRREGAG